MVTGSGRRDAVALIGGLVPIAMSVWIVGEIRVSDNPVNLATEYAAYLGVATLLVTLLTFLIPWWWKGHRLTAVTTTAGQVTAAADQLAQSMLDTWRREAKARRISTPAPVKVRWQWGSAEVTPPIADVIAAPVAGTQSAPPGRGEL